MAELILAIKDIKLPTSYRKGDIIEQFNNRRIAALWIDCLTKTHLTLLNSDGLRPIDSMAFKKQVLIMQYKMERVSKTEVMRTDLLSLKQDIISNIPNGKNEYIYLDMFISNCIKNPSHKIFGSMGHEVWFGGHANVSQPALDLCWDMIEKESKNIRTDFTFVPLGKKDLKCFLSLKFKDFTDEVGADFVKPVYEPDLTIKEKPALKLIQKRKNYVDWEAETEISGITIDAIKDNTISVDLRDKPDNELTLVRERWLL